MAKKRATRKYYEFGSYEFKTDALRSASILRKHGHNAYVRKNTKTGKWDTLYGDRKR